MKREEVIKPLQWYEEPDDDDAEPCPSCGAIGFKVINGKCSYCHCSLAEYSNED